VQSHNTLLSLSQRGGGEQRRGHGSSLRGRGEEHGRGEEQGRAAANGGEGN